MDERSAGSLLELAEELAPGLRGLDREWTFSLLGERYDELLEALRWFAAAGRTDESIRLARSLAPYWQATRRLEDATEWFERVLSLPGGGDDARGRACVEAGFLWFLRGDDERATALYDRALEVGRPTVSALALSGRARIALRTGDFDAARRLSQEALALSEGQADPTARGSAMHVLGVTAQMAGDLEEARRWMTERVELTRAAENYAGFSLEASNLAMVERQLGNVDRADELSREALEIFRRRRDEWAYPFGVNGLAAVAIERGELERAATLIGAAEARVEEQGAAWPPDELEQYERMLGRLERSLDPADFERARAAGRARTPDEAVAYALGRAS